MTSESTVRKDTPPPKDESAVPPEGAATARGGGRRSSTVRAVVLSALVVGLVTAAGIAYRAMLAEQALPAGFASGNGRIEATEVDIASKLPGRLSEVSAREGDLVEVGQLLARMNTDALAAQLREAEARWREAVQGRRYAEAIVAQRQSELAFARAELGRTRELSREGHVSKEQVDRDATAERSAATALEAARAQVDSARASIEAAQATTERIKTDIEDSQLTAPIAGRILYRLTEPGEVLPAGGKVLTVLDVSDVYMTIFLPTAEAGRVQVGAEARIILDALPQYVLPARVSFVAAQSQFTPKQVETRTEREKLMFRVKIKIAPDLLKTYRDRVKTGVPGEAYARLDPRAEWPERLRVRLPSE